MCKLWQKKCIFFLSVAFAGILYGVKLAIMQYIPRRTRLCIIVNNSTFVGEYFILYVG